MRTIKEEDDEKASEDLYPTPKSKTLVSPELVDIDSKDGLTPDEMKRIMSKDDLDTSGEGMPPTPKQTARHSILNIKSSKKDPNVQNFLAFEFPKHMDSSSDDDLSEITYLS